MDSSHCLKTEDIKGGRLAQVKGREPSSELLRCFPSLRSLFLVCHGWAGFGKQPIVVRSGTTAFKFD